MNAIDVNKCPRCNGTGHDKKGSPIIKMVPMAKGHKEYVSKDNMQRKYHTTIKQGSGCMMCMGRGFVIPGVA